MSLATAHKQGPRPNDYYRRGCGFGRWVASLPATEREAVDGMLADPDWEHAAIAAAIDDDPDYPGVSFRPDMVSYHRRGECSCDR